ncbi:hypothetical protein JQS43_00540 [Natronosporangium hydrolyticum]|uniref:Uncharacterized protein n=1 Tax=Natronosporangium hydrolyticum TaxID=2811111 RepID=A0A895YHD3_9ACTN|nr:hypothetical protein [Natronosporangium hydrolyticum]QSB14919.1 hypothetical protein JQS43_00540 [Natronosporangium hydrolyticum]
MAGGTAHAQRRTGGVRLGGFAAALLLVSAVAVGCGEDSEFEWPDDPVPDPGATADPAVTGATEEILATLDELRRVEVAAQAQPRPAHEALDQFTDLLADPLLSSTLFELEILHNRGLARQGEPSWRAEVAELRLDDEPPAATVRECLDASDWQLVQVGSGQPAGADGLPGRYRAEPHLIEFAAILVEGRWLFAEAHRAEVDQEGDGPC